MGRGASRFRLDTRREQVPAPGKSLEFVSAALGELQSGTGNQIGDDTRYQNLARLLLRHHARGRMHRNAADIVAPDLDFAGVKARAHG